MKHSWRASPPSTPVGLVIGVPEALQAERGTYTAERCVEPALRELNQLFTLQI